MIHEIHESKEDLQIESILNVNPSVILFQFRIEAREDNVVSDPQGRVQQREFVLQTVSDFAIYLLHYRRNTVHPSLIKHLEPELNPVSLQRSLIASQGFSIVRMLEDLPVMKVFYISHAKPDPVDKYVEIPGLERVQGIVRIAPLAYSMLKLGTRREVDASFRVMFPCVYYIPTAVIQSGGLACGFSIAPIERSIIYSRWENCLRVGILHSMLEDLLGRKVLISSP